MKKTITWKLGSRAQMRLVAILGGLAFCLVLILLFGKGQRTSALASFFLEPIATASGWRRLVGVATVYIFVAMGVCILYQCRQYSLISEGAFMSGACATTLFLLNSNTRPTGYVIVMGLLIGTLTGSLLGLVPALMGVRRRVNVTLSSVLVDFVVLEFTTFLLQTYLSDPSLSSGASFSIPARMRLPYLYQPLGIRVGILFALLAVLVAYLVLYRTRVGYTLRTVGASRQLAGYMGLPAGTVVVFAQVFAGMMAGLGGAVQMMGVSSRYTWSGNFSNVGFVAILVALVADCNPVWVVPSALFYSYLSCGGSFLQRETGIPAELGGVGQATIAGLLLLLTYLARKNGGKLSFGLWKKLAAAVKKEGAKDGTV